MSNWSRINKIDAGNHRALSSNDTCIYLHTMETHDYGDIASWSDVYQQVHNFKMKPSEKLNRPHRYHYKTDAIKLFSRDFISFFASRNPNLTFLLIPAITSKPIDHTEYDDRLVQVCQNVSQAVRSVECANILSVTKELQTAHSGKGTRNPNEIVDFIKVDRGFPVYDYDVVCLLDDVITTGAHFKACQMALNRAYSQVDIAGSIGLYAMV